MKKKVKMISVVVVGILICCLFVRCCLYFMPDNYSCKIYSSSEELVNTFNNSREDFDEMVTILKASDLWDYLFDIDRPYIMSTAIENWDDYLTKEEYEAVCGFMEAYGPRSMRDSYEAFYISFFCKTEDACLYYTELDGDALKRYLSYIGGTGGSRGKVTQLDERCYLIVKQTEFIRE